MNEINPIEQALQAWEKASQLELPPEPPELMFYMPATPSRKLLRALERGWWLCKRRWLFRHHIVPLLAHGKNVERAIGHKREDILWASQLPLTVDAIEALKARKEAAMCS